MSPGKSALTWRLSLFMLIFAAIFWLGASSIRVIIGNVLLETGTLEFEEYLPPDAEREMFRLLSIVSLVVISSYVGVLISSIVFLVSQPFPVRENGWLMMSALLFYLFVPVELFTMYLDARMIYLEFFTTADRVELRELFIARVAALSGTPFIALLCYYTVIGLAVFQPLRRTKTA